MARLVVAGVLITALVTAAPAHAEQPPAPVAEPEAGANGHPTESASDQEAARLFHEAEARYAEGDLAGALASMQGAYARSGRPELLFNLGELRRELGECVAARKNYGEYLARVPDGRRRDDATYRLDALGRQCADTAPPPAPVTASAGERKPYWTPAKIAGWATIGAGVAAAVGGTYFAVQASRDEARLEERIKTAQSSGVPFTQGDKQLENDGQRSAAWAGGLFAGAAVLVTAGVTLLVLQPRGDSKPTTALTLGVDARTATATWRGSF